MVLMSFLNQPYRVPSIFRKEVQSIKSEQKHAFAWQQAQQSQKGYPLHALNNAQAYKVGGMLPIHSTN